MSRHSRDTRSAVRSPPRDAGSAATPASTVSRRSLKSSPSESHIFRTVSQELCPCDGTSQRTAAPCEGARRWPANLAGWGSFPRKVDGFVPRAQHVNLRTVLCPALPGFFLARKRPPRHTWVYRICIRGTHILEMGLPYTHASNTYIFEICMLWPGGAMHACMHARMYVSVRKQCRCLTWVFIFFEISVIHHQRAFSRFAGVPRS